VSNSGDESRVVLNITTESRNIVSTLPFKARLVRSRALFALVPTLVAGIVTGLAPAAHATANNDNFWSAQGLSAASGSYTMSNVGATVEPGEPALTGHPAAASLWFHWTPAFSSHVVLTTQGSAVDTRLAAYTGSTLTGLTQVAANDDAQFAGIWGVQSKIGFQATAGKSYMIALDGYTAADVGKVVLNWTSNDAFVAATALPSNPQGWYQTMTGTTEGTTKEAGEPDHGCGQGGVGCNPGGASVWFSWTPSFDGVAVFHTMTSTFDTLLGVYTGNSVSGLTYVAGNDDQGGTTTSLVQFDAHKGMTYRIAVDGAVVGTTVQTGTYNMTFGELGPRVNLSGSKVSEGNSGTRSLPFTVKLSAPAHKTTVVQWKTQAASATANIDYIPGTGSVTFYAGDLSKTFNVQVNGDTVKESDETVGVVITAPNDTAWGTMYAQGTIANDD
jgi:hypothetical protein